MSVTDRSFECIVKSMTIQDIADELGIKRSRCNYFREMLKKHDMINPKPSGTKMVYDEGDVQLFRQLHANFLDGANTATEALRLLKAGITPAEAMEANKRLNKQLAAAQRKIVELRKPTFWERINKFWNNLFRKQVSGELSKD